LDQKPTDRAGNRDAHNSENPRRTASNHATLRRTLRTRFRNSKGSRIFADLAEIAKLIDEGKVKPVVGTVLPLADARRAHELSGTGHARGKIILKVA